MAKEPKFKQWQQLIDLIESSAHRGQHDYLLRLLMTPDERDALVARANILNELLEGELSQRQISQQLGVGIATITRGSNELKHCTEQERTQLTDLLKMSE